MQISKEHLLKKPLLNENKNCRRQIEKSQLQLKSKTKGPLKNSYHTFFAEVFYIHSMKKLNLRRRLHFETIWLQGILIFRCLCKGHQSWTSGQHLPGAGPFVRQDILLNQPHQIQWNLMWLVIIQIKKLARGKLELYKQIRIHLL